MGVGNHLLFVRGSGIRWLYVMAGCSRKCQSFGWTSQLCRKWGGPMFASLLSRLLLENQFGTAR